MSIQLAFHNSSLSDDEDKKAEITGMLLLASDFIDSGKVNRAKSLDRISKVNFPIYLFKTKIGQYIPINGISKESIPLPIMQLSTLTEIKEFCGDKNNLRLNKLYDKLMEFGSSQTELVGGYTLKQVEIIEDLLRSPRGAVSGFHNFPSLRSKEELKEEFGKINTRVYDDASLKKNIKDRLDLVEKVLLEEANLAETNYKEKTQFWKVEITNKHQNLKRDLGARDKKLAADTKKFENDMASKVEINLQNFLDGVAKNIRRDEKPIESSIQILEKLTKTAKKAEDIQKIDRLLKQLSDETETLRAAVGFATRQVKNTKTKEEDLRENFRIEVEFLANRAEMDKEVLKEESSKIEKTRDKEMKVIKEERDDVLSTLTKFKDLRNEWTNDIVSNMQTQTAKMISSSIIGDTGNAKLVELKIPLYIFQYSKNGEFYFVVVPPVHLPETFKKPKKESLLGGAKTVYYDLTVPNSRKILSDWLEKALLTRDIQAQMSSIENLLDNPSQLRDTFFNSQSLMVDKLKVDKKSMKKANDRLTEVWTSG
ncbi:MAG: hypothetical protein HeimC2_03730 [Candidatus Heimdallarchaeota archaeon LC_2]|nr:MAG: hypothetical protein HeimC2_03730 [Candidatus Heimdallarchaeota archaeon LC_2]